MWVGIIWLYCGTVSSWHTDRALLALTSQALSIPGCLLGTEFPPRATGLPRCPQEAGASPGHSPEPQAALPHCWTQSWAPAGAGPCFHAHRGLTQAELINPQNFTPILRKMIKCLVASFISLFSSVPVLTVFQMFHLQELVFCSASCRQANRLVKGKRILKQK